MKKDYLFTSESVSEGHPDKVADRISDEILDACLAVDPGARVAVETLVTHGHCTVAGEVSVTGIDFEAVARRAIREIGYADPGFGWDSANVDIRIHAQSHEIKKAVDGREREDEGAGDQGLMFGYACEETPSLMPAPIHYSHRILEKLAEIRKAGHPGLGPDAKSQVTLEYWDGAPARVHTVVVSHQHAPDFQNSELEALVRPVLARVFPGGWLDGKTKLLVNPSGSFAHGGPSADTGLTGRKIIVDTYGGAAPHGGGAFSGKDASKVDRSAAYAARWLAKNVVAAGLAGRCLIQLAYAIGVAEPLAVYVETYGTAKVPEDQISSAIRDCVSLKPRAIRDRLQLDRPIYVPTSAYGHFGREATAEGHFSWEKTDIADELLKRAG
jgi:S-adenosylmethionine synthetase